MEFLLILAVLFLAFANGANDNFKGVATLFGSGRISFRRALIWATLSTLAGSALALFLGQQLVAAFSGKGLVPDALVGQTAFVLAVAVGAALAVFLATLLGSPISTTHALIGALVGAGLVAPGSEVAMGRLGGTFLLPLLLSPVLALGLTWLLYRGMRWTRLRLGLKKESCICLNEARKEMELVTAAAAADFSPGQVLAFSAPQAQTVEVHRAGCSARLDGKVIGLEAQTVLDATHFLSGGLVCFARGLNDTPKIVALLLVSSLLGLSGGLLWVALAMALGGLLAARRVARCVSKEITPMNDGQGFAASLVTAILVLIASRLGVPVSTTHVSVGAIFGIGAATGAGRGRTIARILAAWLITLPVAGLLAAGAGWFLFRAQVT